MYMVNLLGEDSCRVSGMLVNLLRDVVVFWAEMQVSFRLGNPFLGDQCFVVGNDI